MRAVVDPYVNALHRALLRRAAPRAAGDPRRHATRWSRASWQSGAGALAPREQRVVFDDPQAVDELHAEVWQLAVGHAPGARGGRMSRARNRAQRNEPDVRPDRVLELRRARRRAAARAPLWRVHADQATGALLERWLPRDGRRGVLKTDLYDESCTGGLVPLLALRARAVVGIDVSPVVAACGGVAGAACRRSPATCAGCRSVAADFDVVVSNSTLDHFASTRDRARAARDRARARAQTGYLVLTLDNPSHPLVRHAQRGSRRCCGGSGSCRTPSGPRTGRAACARRSSAAASRWSS